MKSLRSRSKTSTQSRKPLNVLVERGLPGILFGLNVSLSVFQMAKSHMVNEPGCKVFLDVFTQLDGAVIVSGLLIDQTPS